MTDTVALSRTSELAVEATVRLDAAALAAPPGVASLLMLRSAEAIARSDGQLVAGHGSFGALLGWWYAAESREFVDEPAALRSAALALDGVVEKIRGGRTLTAALLAEGGDAVPESVGDLLQRAEDKEWPGVQLAVALACLPAEGRAVLVARAVALMSAGLVSDAIFLPPVGVGTDGAMAAMVREARVTRSVLDAYLKAHHAAEQHADDFGRGTPTARALLALLVGAPATTIIGAASSLGVSVPTAGAAVERLEGAGVLREITGRGRDRVFVYVPALALAG